MPLGFQDNPGNILGYDSANNQYASTNVVSNADGSIIERLEYLQSSVMPIFPYYGAANYLSVPITFAALTTGSVASHEILTVTGLVRVLIIPVCTTNVAGSGTIELGVAGDTDLFIGTTTGTDIDAGKLWLDTSPAELAFSFTSALDKIVPNGLDIGYEVKTDTLTSGAITFHVWWWKLDSTGAVVAADGTATL
jgi:hypothetical protein